MSEKSAWDVLNRPLFFVMNAVEKLEAKTQDKIDIYDPQYRQILLECREPDIGALTKVARLVGGRHDRGTEFNIVIGIHGSNEQVLRVARGSATLTFGGPSMKIFDHNNQLLGKLKKKNFALGIKFAFQPENNGPTLILHVKGREVFCDNKKAASISKWDSEYFRESKFDYAVSVNNEVPTDSVMRQILLAFVFCRHRILN